MKVVGEKAVNPFLADLDKLKLDKVGQRQNTRQLPGGALLNPAPVADQRVCGQGRASWREEVGCSRWRRGQEAGLQGSSPCC